jgi:hypothetical protein
MVLLGTIGPDVPVISPRRGFQVMRWTLKTLNELLAPGAANSQPAVVGVAAGTLTVLPVVLTY